MIVVGVFEKEASAKLDYAMSWAAYLATGDSVATGVWTASAGITVSSSPAPSMTDNVATVWLEGGTAGATYYIVCSITTVDGRIDARAIKIIVK